MYLCRVGYIGWNFRGTNIQRDVRTVEGEMERVLGGKVRFLSRTDAGVSAMNNYALCWCRESPFKINELDDIWITGFSKIERKPKVFWRWYRYYFPKEIEISSQSIEPFIGKKDFRYLSIPEGRNTTREVLDIRVFRGMGFTVFDVFGRSFLRQMVRRLVNAIILVEKGINPDDIFSGKLRVPPLPPEGLVLMDMKLDVSVPVMEEKRVLVKERLKKLREEFLIKRLVLSNDWVI